MTTHRTFTRTLARTTAAVTLATAVGVTAAGAAQASGGGPRVITTGSCSAGADWKMKAKEDDGRIEVESEVDSNRNGQTWTWTLKHDGSLSAKGTAKTTGPSGSFSIERRTVDGEGTDTFVFRAKNARSGEVCLGTVSF